MPSRQLDMWVQSSVEGSWARDVKLRVFSISMVFNAMRLHEVTQAESISREEILGCSPLTEVGKKRRNQYRRLIRKQ